MNLLTEDNQLFGNQLQQDEEDIRLRTKFVKVSRWHSAGLILYTLCTILMFLELVIVLIAHKSAGGIGGRTDYLYVQERWQLLMCALQFALEITAVCFRQKLAGDRLLKSVWIGVAMVLSLGMLSLCVEHLGKNRQLILFLFCSVQVSAMALLIVTLHQKRKILEERETTIKLQTQADQVMPML